MTEPVEPWGEGRKLAAWLKYAGGVIMLWGAVHAFEGWFYSVQTEQQAEEQHAVMWQAINDLRTEVDTKLDDSDRRTAEALASANEAMGKTLTEINSRLEKIDGRTWELVRAVKGDR
jgi:hypothetical protein